MLLNLLRRTSLLLLAAAFITGAGSAVTAANAVPASHLALSSVKIKANALTPTPCAAIAAGLVAPSIGSASGMGAAQGFAAQACAASLP
jgi:hypothetical protein